MNKQNLNKKLIWLIAALVLVTLSCLALTGYIVLDSRNERQALETREKATSTKQADQLEGESTQRQEVTNQDLYNKCIGNANALYDEYVAKAPRDMSVEEHLMYTQVMAQTRDSQKADCDRLYKD